MSSESNLTSRFQKGQKKSPEEIKKREETKRVNKAIKNLVYEQLKQDLLNGDSAKQKPYYQTFLNNYLKQALKDPNGRPATTIASMIFTPDILTALDASHEREMANDINFALYKLNEDYFQEQRDVLVEINHSKKILVCCSRRAGKCFGKGTKIRLFDGTIKNVEDIRVGDIVLDYNGNPTEVSSTTSGTDKMYLVKDTSLSNNMEFVCNEPHILTIKCSRNDQTRKHNSPYKKGEIYDIPLVDFLKLPKYEQKRFSLFRASIEYEEKEHLIDPYLLGLWLGDGNKECPRITVCGDEKDLCNYLSNNYNCSISLSNGKSLNVYGYYIKGIKQFFKELNLLYNKHIPFEYLHDSKRNRLKLLAGLIDSDGYKPKRKNMLEFCNTNKTLIDNVIELCNSLGFKTSVRTKIPTMYGKKCSRCWTITIKGKLSNIPNVVKRKHCEDSKQDTCNNFTINYLGINTYYGFTLKGNKRFCLEDYTVVHNTEMTSGAIVKSALKNPGSRIIYINLTFKNAVKQIWDKVIKASEDTGLQIEKSSKNDGEIEWVNGSSLRIKGNSNNAEADTLRGESKVSLVIIDEAFHQKNMEYAINEVIMPFLADLGDKATILCTGTPPRIPHTYMEKLWSKDKTWRHYHWTAENNPHIPNFEKFIEEVCKAKGLTKEAPFIQREYYGVIGAYDTEAMVFKNYQTYTELPASFTANRIAIGCDWGFSDYNSIITVAYNTQSGEAYIIEEKKFNKATVTEIITEVKKSYEAAKNRFGIDDIQILCDTNEQSITYELYANQHLPAYNAYKYDKASAIAQLSDWLRSGKIKVNANDIYLKDEFERTLYKRDEDDDSILPEIDDDIFHPDAIMALLYASRTIAFDMGDKWQIDGVNTGGESTNKKEGW